MNRFQSIIEILLRIFLIIVIVINIISIITVKILKYEYPNVFGYSYFEVISESMEPTIKVGDEIFIKLTNEVEKNDIITFKADGGIITHRLVRIDGNDYITKGDNNDSEDKPITKNDIIGKVVFKIPFLGKIKYVITNYYFICLLIVAYVIYEIVIKK